MKLLNQILISMLFAVLILAKNKGIIYNKEFGNTKNICEILTGVRYGDYTSISFDTYSCSYEISSDISYMCKDVDIDNHPVNIFI
jgi:hypothetical protein